MNITGVSPQSSFPLGLARPFQSTAVHSATSPALARADQFSGDLSHPAAPSLGGVFESFLGRGCHCQSSSESTFMALFAMMSVMTQLMSMLEQMNPQGLAQLGQPNFGQQTFGLGSPGAASTTPSTATGGESTVSPTPSLSNPATQGSTNGASPVKIGPGTRVLEIGDSHSVGTFGKELDQKLRSTGAQVSTYASAGATASTFVQGKSTKYGYWQKDANGTESTTGYGTSRQTPQLESLIAQDKPEVIVVNLGANFRGQDPKSQVDQIGKIAQKHGIPVVWVGPPKTSKDGGQASSLKSFDQKMAQAVAPYGTYVPSTPHVSKYSGGDGLHFSGSEGTQIAKQWAQGVFNSIVG